MAQVQRRKQSWTKWRKLISQQSRSGQSVAGFCRRRGLCASHFFWWKKRLREAGRGEFVEVEMATAEAESRVTAGEEGMEIHLAQGRYLRVRAGFDLGYLEAVLAVLEKRP